MVYMTGALNSGILVIFIIQVCWLVIIVKYIYTKH